MSRKLLVAGVAVVLTFGAALVALPAAGGQEQEETFSLVVTKTVEGAPPPDAEFVINYECTVQSGGVGFGTDGDFTFGSGGGTQTIEFGALSELPVSYAPLTECTITEVEDGGAVEVSGEGRSSVPSGTQGVFEIANIVNTFPDGATTEVPTTEVPTTEVPTTEVPTTAAAPAGAVRSAPTFTG